MLVCRQIRHETRKLYYADTVVSLWPYCPQDALPYDNALSKQRPMLLSWRKSRNGILLERNPSSIHQLDLLITLSRETRTICEHFIEAGIVRNAKLKVKDVYIRVCICGALKWLHETPAHVMSFCLALEAFAHNYPTLERVHVLYCGQQWPKWIGATGNVPFPEMVLSRHEVRMFSGANWDIRKVGEKKRSWGPTVGRDSGQVQPSAPVVEVEASANMCELKTTMSWNYTQAHPGQSTQQVPWKERSVHVDYYNSWTVLEERCVRNRPPRQSKFSDTRVMDARCLTQVTRKYY
jgi:hypothetical protein